MVCGRKSSLVGAQLDYVITRGRTLWILFQKWLSGLVIQWPKLPCKSNVSSKTA